MSCPPLNSQHSAPSTQHSALPTPLLSVRDLRVHFPIRRGVLGRTAGWIKAVDGISFDIPAGRTLGLVGESGCGKTTAGRAILRLLPATVGQACFDGTNIFSLNRRELRALRRSMQIVFQDPYGSLNPRMTVEAIVGEPLAVHRIARGRRRRELVGAGLERVGLSPAHMNRYPHEFSGGQRQRISIARAIVLHPRFVVCDECVSALDVSVQAQILNLLSDLQRYLGLTYLFIAHNLAVVRHISDQVAVMYLGRIVEFGDRRDIFDDPRHPYTLALLASIPSLEPGAPQADRQRVPLVGEVPSPAQVPSGCAFHTRCPFATDRCRTAQPPLEAKTGLREDHLVACHYAEQERGAERA